MNQQPKKILAAGHICIDVTPVFPHAHLSFAEALSPGKLTHVDAADIHTGGSVANTGLALKILGNDVTLLGKTGDDAFGGIVRSILAQYGAGGLQCAHLVTLRHSDLLGVQFCLFYQILNQVHFVFSLQDTVFCVEKPYDTHREHEPAGLCSVVYFSLKSRQKQ